MKVQRWGFKQNRQSCDTIPACRCVWKTSHKTLTFFKWNYKALQTFVRSWEQNAFTNSAQLSFWKKVVICSLVGLFSILFFHIIWICTVMMQYIIRQSCNTLAACRFNTTTHKTFRCSTFYSVMNSKNKFRESHFPPPPP